MMDILTEELNLIDRIIDNQSIKTLFQPIITVKSQKIMILEALSRGIDSDNNVISPFKLFSQAAKLNRLTELDKICIEKALIEFTKISNKMNNILLSVNVNVQSIIKHEYDDWFHKIVQKNKIDPQRIIIEILEDSTAKIEILEKFVNYNKAQGYLIALDDIGSGYSGLIRISTLKPDIIKIDKSLILNISNKKSNQMIVRSLIELGHRLGILVTSEGIETVQDGIKLIEIGVDLQQGYYYSKPNSDIELINKKTAENIKKISELYKLYIEKRYKEIQNLRYLRIEKIHSICNKLKNIYKRDLEKELHNIIQNDYLMELVYVLNNNGIMITNTVCKNTNTLEYSHYIFKPANIGEDFSLKNYFLNLNSEKDVYISSPYISTATGIECVTASKRFATKDNIGCVLCVDLVCSYESCELD